MAQKFGLGRGLESLFNENQTPNQSLKQLRLSEIEPNENQPRKDFSQQALQELADSIKQHGLLQPIVVRPTNSLNYQIVAGERRWRASRLAGLESVPVIIKEMTDDECRTLALIENLQREDLNAVEEALGYKQLMEKNHLTQEGVAEVVGKSRSAVANAIRLLNLPENILELLKNGKISSGHARAMLSIDDDELLDLAVEMSLAGASVRQIEKLASSKPKKTEVKRATPTYYKEVQIALTKALGRKIKITKGEKKSTLEIEFYSDSELTDLAKLLGK